VFVVSDDEKYDSNRTLATFVSVSAFAKSLTVHTEPKCTA